MRPMSEARWKTTRVENVPEGLAEPGRWYCDPERGRLYLWPRGRAVDPGFVDAAVGDYRLRAEAPARAMGIRSIEHWGPRWTPGPS